MILTGQSGYALPAKYRPLHGVSGARRVRSWRSSCRASSEAARQSLTQLRPDRRGAFGYRARIVIALRSRDVPKTPRMIGPVWRQVVRARRRHIPDLPLEQNPSFLLDDGVVSSPSAVAASWRVCSDALVQGEVKDWRATRAVRADGSDRPVVRTHPSRERPVRFCYCLHGRAAQRVDARAAPSR